MTASPKNSAIVARIIVLILVFSASHKAHAQAFFVPPDPDSKYPPPSSRPTPTSDQYDPAYPNYYPNSQRPDPGIEIAKEIIKALTTPPPKPPRPTPSRPVYIYPKQTVQPQVISPPKPKIVEPLKNQVVAQPLTPISNSTPFSLAQKADRRIIADMQKQVDWAANEAGEGLQTILDSRKPPLAEIVAAVTNGRPLQDQQRLLEKAKAGDIDVVELATAGDASPEAEQLREYARAAAALKKAIDATKTGRLSDTMREELHTSLEAGGFDAAIDSVLPYYTMLDTANDVACVLSKAQPNPPTGPVDCILFIGNLPSSSVIMLGGGGCLVGTGGETAGVTLSEASLGQAIGMNIEAGLPVPEDIGDAVFQDSVITNTGSASVNFVVNNGREQLAPGQTTSFPVSPTSRVEFYPSESTAKKAFRLEKAGYEFRLTNGIWEIYKVKHTITIDNSENSMDFQYVSGNEHATVKAKQTSVITSPYPIVLRFDDGAGTVRQKRLTKGVFKVALTSRGSLELYAAENVSSPRPLEDLIAESTVDIFGRWADSDHHLPNTGDNGRPSGALSAAPKLFD